MEEEEEDIRKMNEIINKFKTNTQTGFSLEFEDFVKIRNPDQGIVSDEETELEELELTEEETPEKPANVNLKVYATVATEAEQKCIDSCEDANLKRLLIMNRAKHMKLREMYNKSLALLQDIQTELRAQRERLKTQRRFDKLFAVKPRICLAAPYFKDEKYFSAPYNSDYFRKRSNNELILHDMQPVRKWREVDSENLLRGISANFKLNKINDLKEKIEGLKQKLKNKTEDDDISMRKEELERELEEIENGDNHVPPLNDNKFINWYGIAETFLRDRFTADECRNFWTVFLHPHINKSEFTNAENESLLKLVEKYKAQNWDLIASELNTNRSAFIVCKHYFFKLKDDLSHQKFTPQEDEKLLKYIQEYKNESNNYISFGKIAQHFPDRSRSQLYHRYTYFLSQNNNTIRKGPFTEAEDILLLILVDKFGKKFTECAKYMPRTMMQIKNRFNSHLQRDNVSRVFSSEEDEILLNYVRQNGDKKWGDLAETLSRSRTTVRQRYLVLKKFFDANPNAKISHVPKRKSVGGKTPQQYDVMRVIANQYKNVDVIPTIEMIEEILEVKSKQPGKNTRKKSAEPKWRQEKLKTIDDMLIDYFSSSVKIKQNIHFTPNAIHEAVQNTEEVLTTLEANLDVPDDFGGNPNLDEVDKAILSSLQEKKPSFKQGSKLIPPNLCTLVGLRSLLIKKQNCDKQKKSQDINFLYDLPVNPQVNDKKIVASLEQNLEKLSEHSRNEVLKHRNLFSERVTKLFKWSSILSIEKPNFQEQAETCSTVQRTYSKRKVPAEPVQSAKKQKIETSVKVVEVDANLEDFVEEDVEEEEMEDIKKLDLIIKDNFRQLVDGKGSTSKS